jgi:hypothetical protein
MADQIRWQDRDAGEKFSLVMIGLCVVLAIGFLCYAAIASIVSGEIDWFAISMAALFTGNIMFAVRNWRRDHAR